MKFINIIWFLEIQQLLAAKIFIVTFVDSFVLIELASLAILLLFHFPHES